jgi:hypothetical protein
VVVAVVATVSVEVTVVVAVVGLSVQVAGLVAPVGPVTAQVRATLAVKPFDGTTVMTDVFPVVAPATRLSVVGAALRVKFGGTTAAVTIAVTVAVDVLLPDVPVTVTA